MAANHDTIKEEQKKDTSLKNLVELLKKFRYIDVYVKQTQKQLLGAMY